MFDRAIAISLVIHSIVLAFIVGITFPHLEKKTKNRPMVEISYQEVKKKPIDVRERPIKPTQQLDLKKSNITNSFDVSIPVSLSKDKGQLPAGLSVDSKPDRWRSLSSANKRVTVVPISTQKINNPAYAAYNEMVRSRIEERVYANYDQRDIGRVYLTFIVDHEGRLKVYKVISERTTGSSHLQKITLLSLQQAAAFPAFLKGMTLPEYTFNIEVQYQMNE